MEDKTKYKTKQPVNAFAEYGKIPPQAIELEEAVLGALMLEKDALNTVAEILRPETFYKESHQRIYTAIQKLFNKSEPVDILTVTNELKNSGELELIGGPFYITQLTNRVASSANIEYHSRILSQKFIQRELIRVSTDTISKAFNDETDVFELLEETQNSINDVNNITGSNIVHVSNGVKDLIDIIDKNQSDNNILTGVPTCSSYLDKFTCGFQKGNLITIGGESGNGKTSFALNTAFEAALKGYKVGIWSAEMPNVEISAKLASLSTNISAKKLLMEKLSESELMTFNSQINKLIDTNIFVDDCKSTKFDYLISSINNAKLKKEIDIAVIDYLQLFDNSKVSNDETKQVGNMAKRLKTLAKALNIPIVQISSLTKSYNDPRPTLSRLKQSGDIEYASDVILFTFFPKKYGYDEMNFKGSSVNTDGIIEIIIAKGRLLGISNFLLNFNPDLTKFSDYIEDEIPINEYKSEPIF